MTVGVQLAHQLSFHLGLMCHRLQGTIIIFNVKTLNLRRILKTFLIQSRPSPFPNPLALLHKDLLDTAPKDYCG